MKSTLSLILILVILNVQWVQSQDIIQKLDNSTISCKVIEITETSVIYKSLDHLTGPNRSIVKKFIKKIIYGDSHIEFFNDENDKQISADPPKVNPGSQENAQPESSKEPDIKVKNGDSNLEYEPIRFLYGFNSTGYYSLGVEGESRLFSDFVNIGIGYWTHGYSDFKEYGFGSLRIYPAFFVPINKVTNNVSKINRGFFPFFHPSADIVLQFLEGGDTYFNVGFTWKIGTDYYITDKFGLSYSYSKGNFNNVGISFRW